MMIQWKKLLIIVVVTFIFYVGYVFFSPTKIIGVYKGRWVIVHNIPYLKSSRINWWKNNEKLLKSQYNIPGESWDVIYGVTIIDIGDGFSREEPKKDSMFPGRDISYLICFDEINADAQCLNKGNRKLEISKNKQGVFVFTAN